MDLAARRSRRARRWAILLRPRALLAIAIGIAVSLGGLAALAWRQHAADSRRRDARLELLSSALRLKPDSHAHGEDAHVHEASSQQRAMLAAGGSSGEDCAAGLRHGTGSAVQDSDIICRWMPAPDEAVAARGKAPSQVATGGAASFQQQDVPRRQCCCVSRRRAADSGQAGNAGFSIDDDEDDEMMRSADALAAAFQYFAADAWRMRRDERRAAAAAAASTTRVGSDSLAPGAASPAGHVGQAGDSLPGRPSAPSLLVQLLQRGALSFTCLPTVVIAGAQKAGTTALLGYLLLHPQFLAPPLYKELHHLDKDDRFYGRFAAARAARSGRGHEGSSSSGAGGGGRNGGGNAPLLRNAAAGPGVVEAPHAADDALPQGHSQQQMTGDSVRGSPSSGLARYLHLLPDYYRAYSTAFQQLQAEQQRLLEQRKDPVSDSASAIPGTAPPGPFATFVGARITADASPSYALGTDTARRIAVALPEARVVMLLRDPAERAFSE
jgi:hypothetical protein